MYYFREYHIRDDMVEALRRYIDDRIHPGSFLSHIICDSLSNAVSFSDDDNLANLPAFVHYLYNEAPNDCWGSYEKMQQWLNKDQQSRDEDIAASRRCKQVSEDNYIFHKLHRAS